MVRRGNAVWRGGLRDGQGVLAAESGVLSRVPYSFAQRFEGERGTNPEELIATAHAACFAMALSGELGKTGVTPDSIEVQAAVTLEKVSNGFAITSSHLTATVVIPHGDQTVFERCAQLAKEHCPVSRLLKAEITMNAKLIA